MYRLQDHLQQKNFKSKLVSCIDRLCVYVCVYYPVDIYFEELFGFDGLELSFFQKILMQAAGKGKG